MAIEGLEPGRWYECRTGRIEDLGGVNVVKWDPHGPDVQTFVRIPDEWDGQVWVHETSCGQYLLFGGHNTVLGIDSDQPVGGPDGAAIEMGWRAEQAFLMGDPMGAHYGRNE